MSPSETGYPLTYTTTTATAAIVRAQDGTVTHEMIVVESEGYALVRGDGDDAWREVTIANLELADEDDNMDGLLSALIDETDRRRG